MVKKTGHSLRSVSTYGRKSGHWVSPYADKLIEDYTEHIGVLDKTTIKNQIIEENYQNYDNLRSIKRNVMNRFVGLVGKDSAWKEYVNSEQGEQDCQ